MSDQHPDDESDDRGDADEPFADRETPVFERSSDVNTDDDSDAGSAPAATDGGYVRTGTGSTVDDSTSGSTLGDDVGSALGGVTTALSSRRARFDAWRHDRPFLGGLLLLLSGIVIAYVPMQFATELMLIGGSLTFIGLLFAVLVFLSGVFVLMRPEFSREIGIFGVAMAILSIFGALGGLVVGMLIGVMGGNLCIAWRHPSEVESDDGGSSSSSSSSRGVVASLISVVR